MTAQLVTRDREALVLGAIKVEELWVGQHTELARSAFQGRDLGEQGLAGARRAYPLDDDPLAGVGEDPHLQQGGHDRGDQRHGHQA